MITVKIIGGLGNQMFQYALGRSLAKKLGTNLKLDITGFETYKLHKYCLEYFTIEKNYVTEKEVAAFQKYSRTPGRLSFLHNQFVADEWIYIKEKYSHFNPEILEVRDGAYLDGYWQSEKYFLPVADDLRKEFTPSAPLNPQAAEFVAMMDDSSISFHVRRGDYVTNKKTASVLGSCDPDYYLRALAKAVESLKDPHIFVFSDDIDWVKETIAFPCSATYVSGGDLQNWEELILMSRCARHILSNSSFSWWGAWLDPKQDKMVIAPARWFKSPTLENKDIAPSSWIRI